jgi:hypothetical protein
MVEAFKRFKNWMAGQLRAGVIECAFGFAAGRGGCAIVNATSGEELQELIVGSPIGPFSIFEVRPLADFNSGMELAIKQLDSMSTLRG